jgi:hypothetical protein
MKKTLLFLALTSLIAVQSFAAYIVVLKNGTQYKAKAKWTIVNGKALVLLESGQSMSIDPSLIDEPKSEQTTKLGLGNVNIINLDTKMPDGGVKTSTAPPSLGSQIKLRKPQDNTPAAAATTATAAPTGAADTLSQELIDKFERAYENIGIFDHKIKATGRKIRAELTADSEDKVFNAISATSFLMVRNAGVAGVQVEMVELFMGTTSGGSAGRFQMSREDAMALDTKKISQQDYFIRKVMF